MQVPADQRSRWGADNGEEEPGRAQVGPLYQGFWKRLVAYFVDGIALAVVGMILVFVLILAVMQADPSSREDVGKALVPFAFQEVLQSRGDVLIRLGTGAAASCVIALLAGLCLVRWGGTPGKLLLGIRVVAAETGRHLTLGRAWAREFLRFYVWMNLGLLLPLLLGVSRNTVGSGSLVSYGIIIAVAITLGTDARKQAWHDKVVRSLCVDRNARPDQVAREAEGAAPTTY